ncbi:11663_t:CDS:2, partial [Rhizophagus irregularis]
LADSQGFLFFLAITNSLFWIDKQKIKEFRSILTLRAVLFPEWVYLKAE